MRDNDRAAINAAYSDWAWNKEGEAVGNMLPHIAARAGFHAGVEWARQQQEKRNADPSRE